LPSEPATARGAVVITGSSTGIGKACALHLDSLGFRVFAGVRKEEDGERLRGEGSARLRTVVLDITDPASIAAARAQVEEALEGRGLDGLVNNAGIAVSGPLEFLPLDELRRQLEVNVVGQIAVTQAFLPALRRGGGRIVNIGSIGGKMALPFVGPYAASKFAMEGLTDSLRRELKPHGVSVSIVRPGAIQSEIWDKGQAKSEELTEEMPAEAMEVYGKQIEGGRAAARQRAEDAVPAQEVADVVAHALTSDRPRTRYLVTRRAKMLAAFARFLPDRAFDRMIERATGS
jgi:NAD(P)-dependent dehydrogenase (short-subunit alcohol dehydrogenase family)